MKIAQHLREKNIAEYLIYMWQTEDLIRANGCDLDKVDAQIVSQFPPEEQDVLRQWYSDLIEMMRHDGVVEKGHLQINRNTLIQLTDLHRALLGSAKFPF